MHYYLGAVLVGVLLTIPLLMGVYVTLKGGKFSDIVDLQPKGFYHRTASLMFFPWYFWRLDSATPNLTNSFTAIYNASPVEVIFLFSSTLVICSTILTIMSEDTSFYACLLLLTAMVSHISFGVIKGGYSFSEILVNRITVWDFVFHGVLYLWFHPFTGVRFQFGTPRPSPKDPLGIKDDLERIKRQREKTKG